MPPTNKRMPILCSMYRNIFVKWQWGITHIGVTIENTKFKQEIRIWKEKIIDYLAPLILNKETDMHCSGGVRSLSELRSLPSFSLNFSVDLLCLLLYNILSFHPRVPMEYGDTWINKTNMLAVATSHHEQAASYQYCNMNFFTSQEKWLFLGTERVPKLFCSFRDNILETWLEPVFIFYINNIGGWWVYIQINYESLFA